MNKEDIIKELDKQNRELGEELSLTKDRLNKTLFEKDHYKHLYSEVKKQKDDVVEYIKSLRIFSARNNGKTLFAKILNEILRMLGEIDE